MKLYKEFLNEKLKITDLKKYILLHRGNNSILDILRVEEISEGNYPICKITKLYTIDANGIKEISKNIRSINIRFSFIMEYFLEHSDNIEELLEIAKIRVLSNKYNL